MCLCRGDHDDRTPTSVSASMTTAGGASTTNSRDAFTATEINLATLPAARMVFGVNIWLPPDFGNRCGGRRRRPDRPGRRSGKPWRGRGLLDAVGGDHGRPCIQLVVGRGFTPRQDRGDTRIGAGENLCPLVPGSAGEPLREDVVHPRVRTDVELAGHVVGCQIQT